MTHSFISDLGAQIEVPAGGTLSRTLHRDERLRLVAFGFDAGEELSEHTSAAAAIIQVAEGRIEVSAGGTVLELNPSSWLCLEPHEPHSVRALEPSVVLLTLVRSRD